MRPKPKSSSFYFRLLREVRPQWRLILGIFLLSLMSPPLALLTPLPLKIAVDSVIDKNPLPHFLDVLLPESVKQSNHALLWLAVSFVVATALLSQLRDCASSMLATYAGEKILRGFRARLFAHVQRLSLSYHDTKGTADSTYRIQYDAAGLQNITVEGALPFFTAAMTFVSMMYVTARINWKLALVALAISPAIFLTIRCYRQQLRSQARELKKLESSALSVVQEVLGAARVVKAFGQEDRERERFVAKSNEGMRARIRLAFLEGGLGLLVAFITAIGTASVLYIGVRDIQSGALRTGDLLYVIGLVSQLYGPLKTISKKVASMQTHLASAERAFALLDEAPDVPENPNALPLPRARGAMEFRNVTFAYEKNRTALHEVSFTIEPGTCLGIVGTTGAGKTTLMNLLTRFYDPCFGQIFLDGIDLRDYRLADLRNQFGIVLQEPVLFSTSVAENIAYARPGATAKEVLLAARAANADEFIRRLPQGYETRVGERGMSLSGGERQRISLARAFLKDAPVLILDEPTSSVDVKTETAIVEAMGRLAHGRTSFIITHRLSALQHCDVILKLESGRIVEISSTHSTQPSEAIQLAACPTQ